MTNDAVSDERLEWLAKYYSSPSNSGFDHEVVFALRELRAIRIQMLEDWKLVPKEPTKEMIAAGQDEHDNCIDTGFSSNADGDRFEYTTISPDAPYKIYRAMLAIAPNPRLVETK